MEPLRRCFVLRPSSGGRGGLSARVEYCEQCRIRSSDRPSDGTQCGGRHRGGINELRCPSAPRIDPGGIPRPDDGRVRGWIGQDVERGGVQYGCRMLRARDLVVRGFPAQRHGVRSGHLLITTPIRQACLSTKRRLRELALELGTRAQRPNRIRKGAPRAGLRSLPWSSIWR